MLLEKLKLKSGADIAASLSADARSDRSLVVAVLKFFEEICLAMNEGLADEATLRKFFRDMLESYYGLFATRIQEQRTDNSHPRPRAYVQIEYVVRRWQQRN